MRMSRLMDSSMGDFESRKRLLQRREIGQAYRKNAHYQTAKSPLLQALENLLLGKTEREQLQADMAEGKQSSTGWNGLQDKEAFTLEEVESSTEKQVVPALIADGDEQTLQEEEQFIDSFTERDAALGTLLPERQMESQAYNRLFQVASMNYLNHIAMVKNGYHSFDEPTFSKTA